MEPHWENLFLQNYTSYYLENNYLSIIYKSGTHGEPSTWASKHENKISLLILIALHVKLNPLDVPPESDSNLIVISSVCLGSNTSVHGWIDPHKSMDMRSATDNWNWTNTFIE